MNPSELERFRQIEKRVHKIAQEFGLLTTDILFELVPAQSMLEAMAYRFPVNFSHWSFGRDYERERTFYDHTGAGIPYEVVWNFEHPRAYLVETNPFALNVCILAHVYGHVDFFLGSNYLKRGRAFTDLAQEARASVSRFAEYEQKYGIEVEKVIDAAMSIQWHQDPDPFADEVDEDVVREQLLEIEHAKLTAKTGTGFLSKPATEEEVEKINKRLADLMTKTPPVPTYDLLWYIINKSPKPLKPWVKDVLTVIRNQARSLAPNIRTKMLDEGWATYWHVRIMRKLKEEGVITGKEYDTFDLFNAGVCRKVMNDINPYQLGSAFLEYIKEAGDRGCFTKEYKDCMDPHLRANWNTGANQGTEMIFKLRSDYSDRMAIEQYFTDDFIRQQELYIYEAIEDPNNPGELMVIIAEDDPEVIRDMLVRMHTHYGMAQVTVENGNFEGKGFLYLKHNWTGYELDPAWRNATLAHIRFLWGRHVFLEAIEERQLKIFMITAEGEIRDRRL